MFVPWLLGLAGVSMNYWLTMQFSVEELEELAEMNLSSGLVRKVEGALAHAHAFTEAMQHASQVGERLDWNAEMEKLLGD